MVNRERAQLILVGALLVATVIFGLSLLLNSLLFAGSSGSGGANAAIAQTQTVEFELQRSLRSLAVRVNHASRNVTATEVGTAMEANVTRFARLYAESRAAAGAASVTVSYDNASSRLGYRIVQSHDADFTDAGSVGTTDWTPVPGPGAFPSSPETAVGWFTANVNVENTSTGVPFVAVAENDSAEVELALRKNGGNLSVEYDPSWASSDTAICGASNGRALVDLYDGSAFTGDCEFVGVGALDGPTSIRFENPDRIEGRYAIVMNRSNPQLGPTSSTYRPCDGRPPDLAAPCVAPVIWSANVTTVVQSDRVRYTNAYNLTIYTEK